MRGGPEERVVANGGKPASAAAIAPGGVPPCFEEVGEAAIGSYLSRQGELRPLHWRKGRTRGLRANDLREIQESRSG